MRGVFYGYLIASIVALSVGYYNHNQALKNTVPRGEIAEAFHERDLLLIRIVDKLGLNKPQKETPADGTTRSNK